MNTRDFATGINAGQDQPAGYYTSAEFDAAIGQAEALGANWVALHVHIVQERWFSRNIFFDYHWTAKDHELESAARRCKTKGLRVMLKPVVLCLDGTWRGMINFLTSDVAPMLIEGIRKEYWPSWFASYRSAVRRYAAMAQRLACDSFCIGSELLATQKLMGRQWRKTIAHAREHFDGAITYELAVADRREHRELEASGYLDEYRRDELWDWYQALDFLSAARTLSGRAPERLGEQLMEVEALAARQNRPILLSRCCTGAENASIDERRALLGRLAQNPAIAGCFV